MSGSFDWGKDGKGEKLPRHIERMNEGTRPAQMKNSGSGSNLPWGGEPKEQAKAYMSGLPKNKGSMLSKTGERGAKSTTSMPGSGKAMSGHSATIKSKSQPIKGKGKK